MSADPLGRFALLAAIEDAAVMPVAGFRHEPRQTPGQSHRDAARWPRYLHALRIEDSRSQLNLASECRARDPKLSIAKRADPCADPHEAPGRDLTSGRRRAKW